MQVNPVGQKLSVAHRAYIAGFLDADGAIMATIERHPEKRFGFRVRVEVKISQANRKVLDWIFRKVRVGTVRKNRTTFDWMVRDQQIAKSLIQMLLPYLYVKKFQARKALQIIDTPIKQQKDLIFVARLADTLAGRNVRSKLRRKNSVLMIQESFSRND